MARKYGDVHLTVLERRFFDSRPMQRLRRVRQLGNTHLVYPGATHSRLSHALGTARIAQDLLDAVLQQRNGPHPEPDLFAEWEAQGPDVYLLKVAESTVLVRLGALLHDLCHVPFGHSVEDDLGILVPHDANVDRFDSFWSEFDRDLRDLVRGRFYKALRAIILSKAEIEDIQPYPFALDVVGNTICADLLDYLPRDHYFMGLPAKLGHRFIDGFYVTRSDDRYHPERMAIRITRNGRVRADVITELFKYLRYRYELSERGLVHHAKLAADAMVGKTLEMWYDDARVEETRRIKPELLRGTASKDIDALLTRGQKTDPNFVTEVNENARAKLEAEFRRRGDDGLLEWLLDWADDNSKRDRRRAGIAALAAALLDRKLYKLAGRSNQSSRLIAHDIHSKYGGFEERRRLEEEVAVYAGLEHRWQVVLWIPPPDMRLKAAEVLVAFDNKVLPLKDWDRDERGKDIYESHQALWAINVYVHPEVDADETKKKVILAWLADKLGVAWDDVTAQLTLEDLAVQSVGEQLRLDRTQEKELAAGISAFRAGENFDELLAQIYQIAQSDSDSATDGHPPDETATGENGRLL